MNFEDQILTELRELRALMERPAERPDDLVDAAYIAARTGLSVRTVKQGKAGTSAIPRVQIKTAGASRPVIRYQRAAVDNWIRRLAEKAAASDPQRRALSLISRRGRA